MSLGPWEHGRPFTAQGIQGKWRWLNRIWHIALPPPRPAEAADPLPLRKLLHRAIQRATDDMEKFRFNTLIATLMELTNSLTRALQEGPVHPAAWEEAVDSLLLMLAPLAPHIAEELWERRGRPYSVHQQPWPSYDPELARPEEVTLVVQVNGRLRDRLTVPADISEEEAKQLALGSERVRPHIGERPVRRIIYVPGKLVNIVVG